MPYQAEKCILNEDIWVTDTFYLLGITLGNKIIINFHVTLTT